MVQWNCNCLNILVHLTGKPIPIDLKTEPEFEWVIQKTKLQTLAKANVSIGGIRFKQIKLTQQEVFEENNAKWTLWKCLNCNCDTFLVCNDHTLTCLINCQIPQKEEIQTLSSFGIILDQSETNTQIIQGPDESNSEALATFQSLQNQLDELIKFEYREMEERIDEFIRQQNEQFQAFQNRVYRERNILWNKICAVQNWQPTNQIPISSPPSNNPLLKIKPAPSKPILPLPSILSKPQKIEDSILNEEIDEIAKEKPQKPKKIASFENASDPKKKKKKVKLPQDDPFDHGIFSFDEENAISSQQIPSSDDEKEEEEEKENNRPPSPVTKKASDLFGTSLPISIPKISTKSSSKAQPPLISHDPPNKLKRQRSREETISLEITSKQDFGEELLSQSFDVPYSRNRTTSLVLF